MLFREEGQKGPKSTKHGRDAASSSLMRLNRAAGGMPEEELAHSLGCRGVRVQASVPFPTAAFSEQAPLPSSPCRITARATVQIVFLVSEPPRFGCPDLPIPSDRGHALLWHLCTASRVGFRRSEGFTRQLKLTAAVDCAKSGGHWA